MGQYQKPLYGSTLYGHLYVFYGRYISDVQDAQEKFTGTINHTITATLPFATYEPTADAYEYTFNGTWTRNSSNQMTTTSSSANFQFKAAGSSFEVFYKTQQGGAQNLHLELWKEDESGALVTLVAQTDVNTYSLSTPSVKSYKFSTTYDMYDAYVVKGTITSGASYGLTLDSIKVLTANIDVEIRGSSDRLTWTSWQQVTSTFTQSGTGTTFTIKGTTPTTYTDVRFIQARLTLVTSDQDTPPTVSRIELQSGNSNIRTKNGYWTGTFDMNQVAAQRSNQLGRTVNFAKALNIKWKSIVPARTTLNIRSSSSFTGASGTYGPITAPYRQNTQRLRLKQGATSHSVTMGPFNPAKVDSAVLDTDPNYTKKFWKVKAWTEWDDLSYMPKDTSGVNLTYIFSKTRTDVLNDANVLQIVENPQTVKEDGTANKLLFSPQSFYLTVKMEIDDDKATPVVDNIDLYSEIDYSEPITISTKTISSVDNALSGRAKLQNLSDTKFHLPNGTALGENDFNKDAMGDDTPQYKLTDKTGRSRDVKIFYLGKETDTKNPLVTESTQEQIYAKTYVRAPGGTYGVLRHYLYNGGIVRYLSPYTETMPVQFSPAITDKTKQYKYYIMNGWPEDTHAVTKGQTLEDIAEIHETTSAKITSYMATKKKKIQYDSKGALVVNQVIYIPPTDPNTAVHMEFSTQTSYTTKSAFNSRNSGSSDTDNDVITISVPTSPEYQYTPWVSEEKIYNGVINYNDIASNYKRRQYMTNAVSGFERTYKILKNDTWASVADKYDVDVNDLMFRNKTATFAVGKTIVIPPNIVIPTIPQGVELDDNPFVITIVDNSVHKEDGTPIDKSFIPTNNTDNPPLTVKWKESPSVTVSIKHSDIPNSRDALLHHDIIRITSVKKKSGMKFTPYNSTTQTGDYYLDGDYINWSPAQDLSSEPAANEVYYVTYVYNTVDYVDVNLGTTYIEETGVDVMWRSITTITKDGTCSPGQDSLVEVPAMSEFAGYGQKGLKDYDYVIEDNDLWVETSITEISGKKYILGTLKNRNPKDNWFPYITPGFYYLKEDEYYMYSETLETPLEEKEIPIAKNVSYEPTEKDMGIVLEPKRTNLITNSTFNAKSWKVAGTFNFKTTDVSAPLDPTNFASTDQTDSTITLSWTKSVTTDVVRYEVSVWDTDIEDWRILTSNVTGNTYTAKKLDDNTLYTFMVAAVDEAANASSGVTVTETTLVAPDKIPPYNVTSLEASGVMASSLSLAWVNDDIVDTYQYVVYRNSTVIATLPADTTALFVDKLTAGTTYRFTVKSKDKAGNLSTGTSIYVTTASV